MIRTVVRRSVLKNSPETICYHFRTFHSEEIQAFNLVDALIHDHDTVVQQHPGCVHATTGKKTTVSKNPCPGVGIWASRVVAVKPAVNETLLCLNFSKIPDTERNPEGVLFG